MTATIVGTSKYKVCSGKTLNEKSGDLTWLFGFVVKCARTFGLSAYKMRMWCFLKVELWGSDEIIYVEVFVPCKKKKKKLGCCCLTIITIVMIITKEFSITDENLICP